MTGTLLSGLGNRKRSPWCGTASPRFVGLAVLARLTARRRPRGALCLLVSARFPALGVPQGGNGQKTAEQGALHRERPKQLIPPSPSRRRRPVGGGQDDLR